MRFCGIVLLVSLGLVAVEPDADVVVGVGVGEGDGIGWRACSGGRFIVNSGGRGNANLYCVTASGSTGENLAP